jgi:crotonobetainyl-CoA:carnitine CoA-transferase CaiB-like acyl-CoA transferase
MRLVGRPDLVEAPWFSSAGDRARNGDLLDEAVAKWIAARPLNAVSAEFERVGAALAPVYDVEQLTSDPQVLARDTITTVEDEDLGPLKMQNVMFRMDGTPGAIRFPGRRLGQDNPTFYRELGLSHERITDLHNRGVI